jgi:hypothetical protein
MSASGTYVAKVAPLRRGGSARRVDARDAWRLGTRTACLGGCGGGRTPQSTRCAARCTGRSAGRPAAIGVADAVGYARPVARAQRGPHIAREVALEYHAEASPGLDGGSMEPGLESAEVGPNSAGLGPDSAEAGAGSAAAGQSSVKLGHSSAVAVADRLDGVVAELQHLAGQEVTPGDVAGLDRCFEVIKRLEGAVVAVRSRVVTAAALSKAHQERGERDTTSYLKGRLGLSGREAKRQTELARGLDSLPQTRAALTNGEIGQEQAAARCSRQSYRSARRAAPGRGRTPGGGAGGDTRAAQPGDPPRASSRPTATPCCVTRTRPTAADAPSPTAARTEPGTSTRTSTRSTVRSSIPRSTRSRSRTRPGHPRSCVAPASSGWPMAWSRWRRRLWRPARRSRTVASGRT